MGVGASELTAAEHGVEPADPTTESQQNDNDNESPWNAASPRALVDFDDLLDVLDMPVDDEPVVLRCLDSPHGGILGAQLLAQQVVLAERLLPGRRVWTLHTLFTRPGRSDRVVEVDAEHLAESRAGAALGLSFRQGRDLVARAHVLLCAGNGAPEAPGGAERGAEPPAASRPVPCALIPWEVRAGSDDVDVWLRVPPLPPFAGGDAALGRALLAYSSMIPASLGGVGGHGAGHRHEQSGRDPGTGEGADVFQAHSHTLTFTEPINAHAWHLMRTRPPVADGRQAVRHGEFRGLADDIGALFETVGLPPGARTPPA